MNKGLLYYTVSQLKLTPTQNTNTACMFILVARDLNLPEEFSNTEIKHCLCGEPIYYSAKFEPICNLLLAKITTIGVPYQLKTSNFDEQ